MRRDACFLVRMERVATGEEAAARAEPPSPKHIVDVLIEERAPKLSSTPVWPFIRPPLYTVLDYGKARRMADAIAPMGGKQALDYIADHLSVRLDLTGLERLPKTGTFFLLCNHPTGISDGVAVYDAIKQVRPDVLFYANSDAHRVCPRFEENLIPVEWVLGKRTRERTRVTLKMTEQAVADGRPIVIFPAGRIARRRNGRLVDPEWMGTAVSLARKYKVPIAPCAVAGPFALLFHTFESISVELRDMTLFHELLNKRGKNYRLHFGPLIPADDATGEPATVTRRIKYYVEQVLTHDPHAKFDPKGPECTHREPP